MARISVLPDSSRAVERKRIEHNTSRISVHRQTPVIKDNIGERAAAISHRLAGWPLMGAVLLSIALGVSAQAADYYVATNGNDSTGNGSIGNPYATLTKAVGVMSAGDTTYLRGGKYPSSSQINMTAIGSSISYYTVTNYPGEFPILDCSGESGSSEGIRITGAYWHLYGLVITNAAHNGINIRGSSTAKAGSFNTIGCCVVVGCRNSGMLIGSSSSSTYLPRHQSHPELRRDPLLRHGPAWRRRGWIFREMEHRHRQHFHGLPFVGELRRRLGFVDGDQLGDHLQLLDLAQWQQLL